MKLSDAMVLGSMMAELRQGDWSSCALGVAGTAIGIPAFTSRRWQPIMHYWPWL